MEAMVQKHIATGSPILKLYAEFANIDEYDWRPTFVPVRVFGTEEEVESPTTWLCGDFTALGKESSCIGRKSIGDFGFTDSYMIKDDAFPTTSTSEGTSNPGHVRG
ncbi:hypothetical protein PVK06_035639 [Gossypium arboreum]|uniref:Uncharacterized protein n=1 Tax=Gossypium arboreum TaxID=29729 RepID=A0ABR0NHV6_GOSAR|nr:hypothetical protein PVK06_035639 [Gossypium arboreum]